MGIISAFLVLHEINDRPNKYFNNMDVDNERYVFHSYSTESGHVAYLRSIDGRAHIEVYSWWMGIDITEHETYIDWDGDERIDTIISEGSKLSFFHTNNIQEAFDKADKLYKDLRQKYPIINKSMENFTHAFKIFRIKFLILLALLYIFVIPALSRNLRNNTLYFIS
jgi:hypothetical protein